MMLRPFGKRSQNSSATWQPVVTFATQGDLSISYATQVGDWIKHGRAIFINWTIITASFTHSTSSGALSITGLPFVSANLGGRFWGAGLSQWNGITKANFTSMGARISANSSSISILACGSGQQNANISAADMPSGGSVILIGGFHYFI